MTDPIEQWTKAQLKRAFAEGRFEDVEQARQAGKLDQLMGVPQETA